MTRPSGTWAHRVVGLGLKTMLLTMPPFFSAKGLCFFSWGKYGVSKPCMWKVERTGRLNVYIENVVR